MEEYLGFIEETGSVEDKVYDLMFSCSPDEVWGEEWNVCPAAIVPGITIDRNCVSSIVRIKSPVELNLAKYSTCFSMQDSIDGIIPLAFTDLYENQLMDGNDAFYLMFGETKKDVSEKIEKFGIEIIKTVDNSENVDKMIDNIIDNADIGDE